MEEKENQINVKLVGGQVKVKVNNVKLDLQVCNARKGGCGGDICQSAKLVASSEENGERVAPGFGKESEDASTAMDSESLFLLAGVLSYLLG